MLNRVSLMGRFTADPVLRVTANDNAVASFTLAVDRDFKSSDGQRDADFLPCVAWRGTAEFIERNFAKGQPAVVTGRIQVRNYTDKDGAKRTATEIIVDNIYFAGPRPGVVSAEPSEEAPDDGELPF